MQWRAFKNQDVSKIGEEDVMKRDDDFSCYRAICVIMKRFSFCHVPLFVYMKALMWANCLRNKILKFEFPADFWSFVLKLSLTKMWTIFIITMFAPKKNNISLKSCFKKHNKVILKLCTTIFCAQNNKISIETLFQNKKSNFEFPAIFWSFILKLSVYVEKMWKPTTIFALK